MNECYVPDWAVPANVRVLQTTRHGGVSRGPWAGFNLGDHVGDDAAAVTANRAALAARLPGEPFWLTQVHGTVAVDVDQGPKSWEADAAVARQTGNVCAVMTADCLPVLMCDRRGTVVAAAHAGWRGLHAGVLETTVGAMKVPPGDLLAWLGPAIGPRCFEVGEEVRDAFVTGDPAASAGFVAQGPGKWLCDLYLLARQRLQRLGVTMIGGGGSCTVTEADRYYSYRRDGVTGRMASLIWLAHPASGV
ncbi:peptidoglycan editing factor PgeF [Dechloromonas sp. H13]|uniref:peptidoglycan editing factor PgeF n=1 Tax=Dechloromonas sp. H13 TaxID=2570193 RepID=UPI00129091BE|nr:peptidoglycan editing factor PgeF [Dechloromonas sp. H13]